MTHYQTRSYLCIQKNLVACFRIQLYIHLNTKQIHSSEIVKIGSIIVPLPAQTGLFEGRFFDRNFAICQIFAIFDN